MKRKSIILILIVVTTVILHFCQFLYEYYAPSKDKSIYMITKHCDDTLRIAYIGDSWALGHSNSWTFGDKSHICRISYLIKDSIHRPVKVESYGIGGLTSKEIYNALFEQKSLKQFMENGYNYCYLSAGINDTFKKMSTSYYRKSIDQIIQFMLSNNIHPIIQEIPDFNIQKSYDDQSIGKKSIRRLSMILNNTLLDCKQQFRDALDDLIVEKEYQDKVTIIRYKSWNNDYANDLQNLYIEDQLHLNYKGYERLDSVIAKTIIEDILHNR